MILIPSVVIILEMHGVLLDGDNIKQLGCKCVLFEKQYVVCERWGTQNKVILTKC